MTQTSSKPMPFQVGDNVVYPTQGAGRIVGQVERLIAGQMHPCFEIELLRGSMKVLVPLNQGERVGLRRITDKKRIPELLSLLKAPDLELPDGWTPRHRREQQILTDGDIFVVAQLLGTLARRDIERSLSATERRVLDDARQMVVTEVTVSLDLTLETATERVDAALGL